MHIDYIMCLADGFTMEELGTAKQLIEQYAAKEMNRTAEVHFIPVIPKIEQESVGSVLTHARDLLTSGSGTDMLPYEILSPAEQMEAAKPSRGYRAVFVDADTKDDVLAVMRSVKSLFHTKKEIVFAMVTPNARQWRIGEYLKHVIEEHEYMKTHPPEQDPDMRRVDD